MKKAKFFYLLRRGFFAGGGGEWSALVSAFKTRVIADGGTLESESCIRDDVKYLIQNPEPVPTPAFTGLLNDYSGAAAAYSLRLLDNTYTGDAIVVRRASDNTTQNIGFVNNELDTASLESFCSGTDGFVTTWYDQSGNGNDAAQATASSQPKIVSAGSTLVDNGKPAFEFDGSNDYLIASKRLNISNIAVTSVQNFKNVSGGQLSMTLSEGSNLQIYMHWNNTSGIIRDYYGGSFNNRSATIGQKLQSLFTNGTNALVYENATQTSSLPIKNGTSTTDINIGRYSGGSLYSNSLFQEVVVWESDQSSNRTGIETNINTHYNIYP